MRKLAFVLEGTHVKKLARHRRVDHKVSVVETESGEANIITYNHTYGTFLMVL